MLLDLDARVGRHSRPRAAAVKMKESTQTLHQTYFAWAGPTTNGKGAYFRIQGPTVFIGTRRRGMATRISITSTPSTAIPPTTTPTG